MGNAIQQWNPVQALEVDCVLVSGYFWPQGAATAPLIPDGSNTNSKGSNVVVGAYKVNYVSTGLYNVILQTRGNPTSAQAHVWSAGILIWTHCALGLNAVTGTDVQITSWTPTTSTLQVQAFTSTSGSAVDISANVNNIIFFSLLFQNAGKTVNAK